MTISKEKIKLLIEHYGKSKGYLKKSYLPLFCEDNGLNYIQWNAYARGAQKIGMKIVYNLIDIFPNLNLNWLFKEEENMFLEKIYQSEEQITQLVNEIDPKYSPEIVDELYRRVAILNKKMKEINKLSEI